MRTFGKWISAAVLFLAAASALAQDRGPAGVRERQDWLTQAERAAIGDAYALVIGINRYKEFTPLRTAANDAVAVAKVLEESYGFKVVLLLDEQATDEAIRDALYDLRAKVGQNDSLLIFFAGHGVLQGGVGYWIPVNGKRKSDANWLEHTAIRSRLVPDWLPAKHILIVADSCYAGALLRKKCVRSVPGTLHTLHRNTTTAWTGRQSTSTRFPEGLSSLTSGWLTVTFSVGYAMVLSRA
jgi:hypothetical protein